MMDSLPPKRHGNPNWASQMRDWMQRQEKRRAELREEAEKKKKNRERDVDNGSES